MGKRHRQSIGAVRIEEGKAVVSRLTSALMRAFLVMVLVATPSVILSGQGADGREVVALMALFAGVLTFVEYNATYPGLVEFRDAPPFNRIRFLMLFATVFALTVIEQSRFAPSTLSTLMGALGVVIGAALDFPYSPVRLATLMLADGASEAQVQAVRSAAGVAYLTSALGLAFFVSVLRLQRWPARESAFNVWVNLPTFDPTVGGDVVEQLRRDSWANIALGFLLPFIIPAILKAISTTFEPITLETPQTMIWTVTAWSFLPTSLFMRGLAMGRIADMIEEKRRLAVGSGYQPA